MNKKLFLKILASIVIMILIFWKIGISKVISILQNTNLLLFSTSFLFMGISIFIKSYRWNSILNSMGGRFKIKNLFKYFLIAMPFQIVSPSRSGDVIRAFLVKRNKMPLYKGFASIVIDRIYDILVLVILGISGAFLFLGDTLSLQNFIPILLIPGLCFVGIIILTNKKTSTFLLKPLIGLFNKVLKERRLPFNEFHNEFVKGFKNKKLFSINLAITLISWLINNTMNYFLFLSLGVDVPLIYVILIPCLVSLSTLVPITFGGVGVREGVGVILFNVIGISSEYTLSVYVLGYFILVIVSIIGMLLYIKNK